MTIINLIILYLISVILIVSIPAIIKALKEVKQWKAAYDKQQRIKRFMEEFEDSMNNIESFNDIDEYIGKAILYD